MNILNSDTNAMVGGFPVPTGTYEFPLSGELQVVTSRLVVTNITVGTGDTLVIWPAGAGAIEGVGHWQMFLLGLWLVVGCFGLLVIARRIVRGLTQGQVKEV